MQIIQKKILESTRTSVLNAMLHLDFFSIDEINELENIKLGLLRKSSVYRHGVTRFLPNKYWKSIMPDPSCVKIVDIHPMLLETEWETYREIILYHEFIHCLGNLGHNKKFYKIESLWPTINQKKYLGNKFMEKMKNQNSKWAWKCLKCEMKVLRQRKSSNRYICKECGLKLIDERI